MTDKENIKDLMDRVDGITDSPDIATTNKSATTQRQRKTVLEERQGTLALQKLLASKGVSSHTSKPAHYRSFSAQEHLPVGTNLAQSGKNLAQSSTNFAQSASSLPGFQEMSNPASPSPSAPEALDLTLNTHRDTEINRSRDIPADDQSLCTSPPFTPTCLSHTPTKMSRPKQPGAEKRKVSSDNDDDDDEAEEESESFKMQPSKKKKRCVRPNITEMQAEVDRLLVNNATLSEMVKIAKMKLNARGSKKNVVSLQQNDLPTQPQMKRKFHHDDDKKVSVELPNKLRKLETDHTQKKAEEKFMTRMQSAMQTDNHLSSGNPRSTEASPSNESIGQHVPSNQANSSIEGVDRESEQDGFSDVAERITQTACPLSSNLDKSVTDSTPQLSSNEANQHINLFLPEASNNESGNTFPVTSENSLYEPSINQYRDPNATSRLCDRYLAASPIMASDEEEEEDLYSGFINNSFYLCPKNPSSVTDNDDDDSPQANQNGEEEDSASEEVQDLLESVTRLNLLVSHVERGF